MMTIDTTNLQTINQALNQTRLSAPYANIPSHAEELQGKRRKDFGDFLMEAVNKMNDQQMDVSRLEEQALVDPDSIDIHDVTTAVAKAQMAMGLAKTVVDRVVTGWSEITTTR
ncbi:MAG: flagellar hook-basal body complex protein FliE [Treponema sp.]|nr:flagellar hook-basal body complex protein FliE [Treponema sp.]